MLFWLNMKFTRATLMKRVHLIRRSAVGLALLVGAVGASAQTTASTPAPTQFDLNGAIRYALEHSFDIRQARERIR